MDNDMTVIDWIGKTRGKKTGFFMLSPVYGESSVQFAYGFLQVGLIAAQIFYALGHKDDAEKALDAFKLYGRGLVVGVYVLPVFSALSFLGFIMARQLLKSEHMVELLFAHDRSRSSTTSEMRQTLITLPEENASHLRKALCAKGVRWMQNALDPSQTRNHVRLMIVLLNVSMLIIGLVFFFVCKRFNGVPLAFFVCAVMPLLAAWLFHLVADTAVFVAAEFCKYRILVMRSDFDSILENEEAEKGQFLSIIQDYIAMDELLMTMSGQISNLIFVSVAGMFLITWYCVDVALQALAENVIIVFVVMIGCSAGILFLLIFLLYPLAQITDLTIGRNSLGRSSSLIVSIHKCGLLRMTADVHGEYIRLLHLMLSCPIGIKVPILGLLRTSDLVMYAKTLAAALPALVTTAVSFAQDDDDNDLSPTLTRPS